MAPSLAILGGQAVQADRLVRAWAGDDDVEAWLVPINPVPPRAVRLLLRIKYARTLVTELAYLRLLASELRRADVVHAFSASYWSFLLAPLPALVLARLLGKRVILNYHSGEAPDHLSRSPIACWLIQRMDRTVVPSEFLVRVFARHGITAEAISNIVDLDHFSYRDRSRLRPRLLSTRNFHALYNVACTIQAFRIVQDRWGEATLTLVGGGPEEARLRALVARLGLRHVTFAGRVAPDKIAQVYADHDIYVQTPNIDNMPLSVIEAHACGLPVVSTDAGGVPTMISSGRNGLLAPVGDYRAVAAHVSALLTQPAFARTVARNGYETCRSCSWTVVRGEWLRLYRSVAGRERQAAAAARRVHHDVA